MQLALEPHGFELGRVHLYTDFFSVVDTTIHGLQFVESLAVGLCVQRNCGYVWGCGVDCNLYLDFPLL